MDILDVINKVAKAKNMNVHLTKNDLDKNLRDLRIDSLAAMTLVIGIETELSIMIPDETLNNIKILRDIVDAVTSLQKKKNPI